VVRLTDGERVETAFLLADWCSDCIYTYEMVTRTTQPLTDRSVRSCLAKQLSVIRPNATTICGASASFSGTAAVVACDTQTEAFSLPVWIVALLCFACLSGMAGDIYRTSNIIQTKKAAWRAETESWGSRRHAAEGKVTTLKQAKENSMLVCTLLEDGLSVGGTVLIETYYVDGPWDTLAQLNVGAAVAALVFKIGWALHNRELAQQKLLGPGGLHAAAAAGDVKGVRWLVEARGRRVSELYDMSSDEGWDGTGITPLILAAVNGRAEVVAYLLSKGASPDAASADGRTPLAVAAVGCHVEVVRLLCTAGASVNMRMVKLGALPLHLAVVNPGQSPDWDAKALPTVGVLLSAGMDPQATVQCPHDLKETPGMEAMYERLNGKTALAMAEERVYTQTAEALRQAISNDSG
jgi:hypothetical protein